jgi:hypothetical protein
MNFTLITPSDTGAPALFVYPASVIVNSPVQSGLTVYVPDSSVLKPDTLSVGPFGGAGAPAGGGLLSTKSTCVNLPLPSKWVRAIPWRSIVPLGKKTCPETVNA